MPWQRLSASQYKALLKKSLVTRRSRILDLAAEVGPVIEQYRAQGYGYRRIAALLNLSDYSPFAVRSGTRPRLSACGRPTRLSPCS